MSAGASRAAADARLRAWWWRRAGLDGSLAGAAPAAVLARAGWARSVGGVGPYLTLHARAGTSREAADAAVARLEIHELPSARGCTYVLPADDFAIGLRAGEGASRAEERAAAALGVGEDELSRLCDAVLAAVAARPLEPDAIRLAVGDRARSLGDAGKKKGLSTTLPLALGRLQERGLIRRVPTNGRLDQQRYAYVRWDGGPLGPTAPMRDEALRALAARFFAWAGPATMKEWQWFSGLGVKAARAAADGLGLVPAWAGSERLLLPDDARAFAACDVPDAPAYALVSSLDPIAATRHDAGSLLDDADREVATTVAAAAGSVALFADLPAHAILDRGRLVGFWEFDAEAGRLVWATFRRPAAAPALRAAVAATEAFVREQLGDARSFSLDSPASRRPKLAAIRSLAGA